MKKLLFIIVLLFINVEAQVVKEFSTVEVRLKINNALNFKLNEVNIIPQNLPYGVSLADSIIKDSWIDTNSSVIVPIKLNVYSHNWLNKEQAILLKIINGEHEWIKEIKLNVDKSLIPTIYSLSQNYPNPFNPATKIKFSIPSGSVVTLIIYDILGDEVKTLLNGYKEAGNYEAIFNALNLPSGVYFYKLSAGEYKETKKMMLLK